MIKIRDNQRSKVYKSENAIKRNFPIIEKEEFYEFIDFVMGEELPDLKYEVAHTRREGAWCQYYCNHPNGVTTLEGVQLNFAPNAMTLFIAVHEICHAIIPSVYGHEAHGPEFAQKQLELTRDYLGERYAQILEEGYDKYGVKYGDSKFSTSMKKAASSTWYTEKKDCYSLPITRSQQFIIEEAMLYYMVDRHKEMINLKKTRVEIKKDIWYEDFVGIIGAIERGSSWCSGSDRQQAGMIEWCWKAREMCKMFVSHEDKATA